MLMFIAAVGPALALLLYFYLRDKYEKEPFKLLAAAFLLGVLIVVPALIIEVLISPRNSIFTSIMSRWLTVGYTSFIVAGLVEEGLKYLAFSVFIYKKQQFNEMYDGIIYAVFVSLGFATIENIVYVINQGFAVALTRALTAVPAHALFGATMGYYFGRAKFGGPHGKSALLSLALFVPVILHGIYDFILLSQNLLILLLFIPYIVILWIRVLKQIKQLSSQSPFRYK